MQSSFYGVNLRRAEVLSDGKRLPVVVNVGSHTSFSAHVEIVSGTWSTAVLAFRKLNAPTGSGADYSTPVTLSTAGMTDLQACESEYVRAETSTGEGSDLIVNIHFHTRNTEVV
jgi:hypothetical protein